MVPVKDFRGVFLSYAHQDRDRARALARALESEGWSVWWDHRLRPGDSWCDVIESRLAGARAVVVLWSRHALRSDYVRDEANDARERGILVPATISGVRPPMGFRQLQAANLEGWKGDRDDPQFLALARTIEAFAPRSVAGSAKSRPSASDRPTALPTRNGIGGRRTGRPLILVTIFIVVLAAALAVDLVWHGKDQVATVLADRSWLYLVLGTMFLWTRTHGIRTRKATAPVTILVVRPNPKGPPRLHTATCTTVVVSLDSSLAEVLQQTDESPVAEARQPRRLAANEGV